MTPLGRSSTEIFQELFSHAVSLDDIPLSWKVAAAAELVERAEHNDYIAQAAMRILLDGGGVSGSLMSAYLAGVRTTEGLDAIVQGTPIEWVLSWESSDGRHGGHQGR